jgi:molybdate transport system substrate-binding protein
MVAPASRTRLKTVLVTAITAVLLEALPAAADEVRVMTSGAFAAAFLELAPQFERATGHRIVIEATSSGTGASIAARLERGEAIDVVIVDSESLDRLIKNGEVRAGTRVDLARSASPAAKRRSVSSK